jgi:hypothetical protein
MSGDLVTRTLSASAGRAELMAAAQILSGSTVQRVIAMCEAGQMTWEGASAMIWDAIGAKAKELREED